MGSFHKHNFGFTINPLPEPGTKVAINISHIPLLFEGLNLPVEIATASAFRKGSNPVPLSSCTVYAHFDTGASITSIDFSLAKSLNLLPTGQSQNNTASGPMVSPTFAVDMSFPNTNLSPFIDLQIGSCKLNFDPKKGNSPKNFGLLLGRDVMSRWNIVWNGPTSTVFISD